MQDETTVNLIDEELDFDALKAGLELEASQLHHPAKMAPTSRPGESAPQQSPTILSVDQYNILAALGRGEGITFTERDYLFESCNGCGLVFVTSVIKHHMVFCRRRHD